MPLLRADVAAAQKGLRGHQVPFRSELRQETTSRVWEPQATFRSRGKSSVAAAFQHDRLIKALRPALSAIRFKALG